MGHVGKTVTQNVVSGSEITDGTVTGDDLASDIAISTSGNISLADNAEIRVGTGNDLVIKHNATNTFMTNTTGALILNGDDIAINKANGSTGMFSTAGDQIRLYHNGTEKFSTTSVGTQIRGGIHSNQATQQGATRSMYTHYENFAWTSTTGGQAQTVTLTNSIPYQKPTPMTFFIYYTSDSSHHDMIHGIMDVGFYNSTFTTVSSNSSDQVANGITIGFTGAYNAKKMTVTMQPHSAYTASNFAGSVYYGWSFHGT